MKNIISVLLIFVFIAGCATVSFKNELEFGNKLAQEGLWKEALYRWSKYLAEGNDTATVHNNMAIALENLGRFSEAEEEYNKALKLAPKHSLIKENLKQLQQFMKREKVKDEK